MSGEVKYTTDEIRKMQCEKCGKNSCECRHCQGRYDLCKCDAAFGEPCSWNWEPICNSFCWIGMYE